VNKLVSICIPTFNGEQFIATAMESAISQTYSNIEIVVSDDYSTDTTVNIIEKYQKKTTIPIKIVKHSPTGIGANWNNCVKHTTGDYIKFLFQDDVLESNCIAEMMAVANANPKVGLIYCKRNFLYEKLTIEIENFINYYGSLHTHWTSFTVKEGLESGKKYLKDIALIHSPKNKIGEPTAVLLKKECFTTIGWFHEQLEQTLDHEYWYRVLKKYDVCFIDKALIYFRLHNNQASNINKSRNIPDNELLYKLYYKNIFWQLHLKNQIKLVKRYHILFKLLADFKHFFNAK